MRAYCKIPGYVGVSELGKKGRPYHLSWAFRGVTWSRPTGRGRRETGIINPSTTTCTNIVFSKGNLSTPRRDFLAYSLFKTLGTVYNRQRLFTTVVSKPTKNYTKKFIRFYVFQFGP